MSGDPPPAFDPGDPAFVADPYPTLAALREAGATFRLGDGPHDAWFVTRFAEVSSLLRDRRLGRVFTHRYSHAQLGLPEPDPRWAAFREHERWSLLDLEPPDHTRIRSLVSAAFTPRAVAAQRPSIEARAAHVVERALAEGGPVDLLGDVARPYSIGVICALLGVPESDGPQLLAWSHAIVRMFELACSDEDAAAATRAAVEFSEYVRVLAAAKRRDPDDLLLAALVAAEVDGERLTEHQIVCTVIVLLNAGHEATVNTVGNGFRALAAHPGEWRRVVSGEVLPRVAVEELLRHDAPLQLFERWVLDPVEVDGRALPVGARLALLFGSANRDPRRFADPDRFDIGRGDSAHIGFGAGIHFCLGAPLARLELEVLVAELARALPAFELAAEPERLPAFVIRGLRALLVRPV